MSVTSGFFNSLNGDRKYNAEQMSSIFDGVISDGVFATIGSAFEITASEGTTINVGSGRAWFNSIWVNNDAILPIICDISEVVNDRIDAVVIEINKMDSVREGSIKVVKGTPSSTPQNPAMVNTIDVHQYPLAYIYRTAGSGVINQSDITNVIGSSDCPFITGLLQVVSISNIVAQWKAQWDEWFLATTTDGEAESSEWRAEEKAKFEAWFNTLEASLSGDVAANFEAQILELQNRFDLLVTDRSVYDDIEDSNGQVIKDSYGSTIEGKTVLTSGDSSGGSSRFMGCYKQQATENNRNSW